MYKNNLRIQSNKTETLDSFLNINAYAEIHNLNNEI